MSDIYDKVKSPENSLDKKVDDRLDNHIFPEQIYVQLKKESLSEWRWTPQRVSTSESGSPTVLGQEVRNLNFYLLYSHGVG